MKNKKYFKAAIFVFLTQAFIFSPCVYSQQFQFLQEEENQINSPEEVKKLIFIYNFEAVREQFKSEIEKKFTAEHKKDEDKAKIDKLSLNSNLALYKSRLKNIITKSKSKAVTSEAYFKLALMAFEENNKDFSTSLSYIEKALQYVENNNQNLFIKENLFAGKLYFLSEKYKKSNQRFKIVKEFIESLPNREVYKLQLLQSTIGMGDCFFASSDFSQALYFYNISHLNIQKYSLELLSQPRFQSMHQAVLLRLLLCYYRSGDYAKALEQLKSYVYEVKDDSEKSSFLAREIKKLGGILLFELKDKKILKSIASDGSYGEFGKEIVLAAFPLYFASGNIQFIDDIASALQTNFSSSLLYVDFMKSLVNLHSKDENKDKSLQLQYLAVTQISKSSLWRKNNALSHDQEKLRHELILTYAPPSAQYYFNLGVKNNFKDFFVKSAQMYEALLEEHPPLEQRGLVLQNYAEALFRAHDLEKALSFLEESLTYQSSEAQLKARLFLKIKITQALSVDASDAQDKSFKNYEGSVDEFFRHFPHEKQAQFALFESAKQAQFLNDFDGAKQQYETLLNFCSVSGDCTKAEKENIMQSLSVVLSAAHSNSHQDREALEGLESYARQMNAKDDTQSKIQNTNASVAIAYFSQLKTQGKIPQSAHFLSSWSHVNKKNPQSAQYYLESLKTYAQLQEWKICREMALAFDQLYPNNTRTYEASFWLGKANDNLLLFAEALSGYEKSLNLKSLFPSLNEMNFAVKRALEISHAFKMKEREAKLFEIKEQLQNQEKFSLEERAKSDLNAARLYFECGQNRKALALYERVLAFKKLPLALEFQAKLGSLLSGLTAKTNDNTQADEFIARFLSNNPQYFKNLAPGEVSQFLIESLEFMNKVDEEKFSRVKNLLFDKAALAQFKLLASLQSAVQRRAATLNTQLNSPHVLTQTYLLAAKMSDDMVEIASYVSSRSKESDYYLKSSLKYQMTSKKLYYTVLSSHWLEQRDSATAYGQAQNYFSLPGGAFFPLMEEDSFYEHSPFISTPQNMIKGE